MKSEDWIKIDESKELPENEVLCYGNGDFLIGFLARGYGSFYCEDENTILRNVTHYQILVKPL